MLLLRRVCFSTSATTVKRTTGLVGLPVEPRAREVLVALYEKTLKDIQVAGGGGAIRRLCVGGVTTAIIHPRLAGCAV